MSKVHNQCPTKLQQTNEEADKLESYHEVDGKNSLKSESVKHNPQLSNKRDQKQVNPTQTDTKLNQKINYIDSYSWKTFFVTLLIFILLAIILGGGIYGYTQFTKMANQIEQLSATVQIFGQRANQISKQVSNNAPVLDTTPVLKWIYFNQPWAIPHFRYDNLRENIMKFDEIVPKTIKAKQVKFILFSANCGVTVWNDYWVKLRTITSKGQDYHFTWGISSPFTSCMWNSEFVTLSIEDTREIRVQASRVHQNNELRFYFVGYSYQP